MAGARAQHGLLAHRRAPEPLSHTMVRKSIDIGCLLLAFDQNMLCNVALISQTAWSGPERQSISAAARNKRIRCDARTIPKGKTRRYPDAIRTARLGNVTVLTVIQKRVPPGLLGRVMATLMLCSFGSFPLSVAVSGLLVHRLGPTPFFPVAGALIAVAILGGLTQREFRAFGARDGAQAADDPQAAEGSRK